jgi:DMSO/TMAO reductase YedYZ molybdopterin-dependent catalytic subunit
VALDQWEFTIDDGTNVLQRWNWKSFLELSPETFTVDLHCVTRWSKLGTSWESVSLDTMLAGLKTDELIGHASIVTTMRYMHATDQGKRGAITVLSEYRRQRSRKDGHKLDTTEKRQAQ